MDIELVDQVNKVNKNNIYTIKSYYDIDEMKINTEYNYLDKRLHNLDNKAAIIQYNKDGVKVCEQYYKHGLLTSCDGHKPILYYDISGNVIFATE